MLKICDRTLSLIDDYTPTKDELVRFIQLLTNLDCDYIELSPKMAEILKEVPKFGSFILRIEKPSDADDYPMYDAFICPRFYNEDKHIFAEVVVHDVNDSTLIMQHGNDKVLRIAGLDDLYREQDLAGLQHLKNYLPKRTEFSPGNAFNCAVAIGMDWINQKCGDTLVTSFGGIGGLAPFEEVLVSMRQLFRRHPQTYYDSLPDLRDLMTEITGRDFPITAPIVGSGIFTVESGIHVSGILKHPKCYEPFPPESVGGERRFTYGKLSGKDSIRHKLKGWGYSPTEAEIIDITKRVKSLSEKLNRNLSDEELRACYYEGEKINNRHDSSGR